MRLRLQKFLADRGLGSRRSCEAVIQLGKVQVNGKVVTRLGTIVDPAQDEVTINGRVLPKLSARVYLALNKPTGYLTTASDPYGRPTVYRLIPKTPRLFPIGRLDQGSSGLLLFTNDGAFAEQLLHPRYGHEREYEVALAGPIGARELTALRRGVALEEGLATFDQLQAVDPRRFSIVVRQGWKRQVRRMFEAVGGRVSSLRRVRIGKLKLGRLREGEWRWVRPADVV